MYKLSVIESRPIIREGLALLLNREDLGFCVCNCHANCKEFLQEGAVSASDVVVVDINFDKADAVRAISDIKNKNAETKVLVFSESLEEDSIKSALRAGADGYLHKDAKPKQIIDAVMKVLSEQFFLSEIILTKVINAFIFREEPQPEQPDMANLTARECEMLKLISRGLKNKEIANILFISVKTVEAHRSHLMKKLNVHNGAGLASKAMQFRML